MPHPTYFSTSPAAALARGNHSNALEWVANYTRMAEKDCHCGEPAIPRFLGINSAIL